jgi:hypothetical protein
MHDAGRNHRIEAALDKNRSRSLCPSNQCRRNGASGRSFFRVVWQIVGHSRRSVLGVGEAPTRVHRLSVLTLLALGRKDSVTAQQFHRFLIKTIASRFAVAYQGCTLRIDIALHDSIGSATTGRARLLRAALGS